MKNFLAIAAFALASLAATSAHAQSTISPVPGGADAPHQTAPTKAPDQSVYGQTRSDGQQMPNNRGQYKGQKMRGGNHVPESKEARKQMKKQTTSTGTM
jgi:hypothetical protein